MNAGLMAASKDAAPESSRSRAPRVYRPPQRPARPALSRRWATRQSSASSRRRAGLPLKILTTELIASAKHPINCNARRRVRAVAAA